MLSQAQLLLYGETPGRSSLELRDACTPNGPGRSSGGACEAGTGLGAGSSLCGRAEPREEDEAELLGGYDEALASDADASFGPSTEGRDASVPLKGHSPHQQRRSLSTGFLPGLRDGVQGRYRSIDPL